jgi:hypothetical protein
MWARILDASGVAALSSIQVPFDPLNEQVFVNEVRVMDSSMTLTTRSGGLCLTSLDKSGWF